MQIQKKFLIAAIGHLLIFNTCVLNAKTGSNGSVWWNWYEYPKYQALLKMLKMRKQLQRNNLYDTYERFPDDVHCPPETLYFRTADGTCNNLENKTMGAQGVRFGRNVPLEYTYRDADLLSPNPRELSLALFTRQKFKPILYLNMFALNWIQFMTHDWFGHGENDPNEPFSIPLQASDPFGESRMIVARTQKDHTHIGGTAPTYLNENTHWWDGSQIYGSQTKVQYAVRAHKGGLLRVTDKARLPIDSTGVEITGFRRNWWLGVSLMHLMFTLEHNAIAKKLIGRYPNWSDERLFQTARLINAALMSKIHTVEWTPAILDNEVLKKAMETNWYGFIHNNEAVKSPKERLLPGDLKGLVGGEIQLHGVPYSMTEEFVSVYRMHPLLPESISIYSSHDGTKITEIPIAQTRDKDSHSITDSHRMEDLMYSMGISHPGSLELQNYPNFLQNLDVPFFGKTDLGAVDILRDRERGTPRYNQFRRLLGLTPINTFNDFSLDPETTEKLKKLYHNDVEKIDALVGCLAEGQRPPGFGFGETTFQIFILMASRRLESDRFYTTHFTKEVYTSLGIEWIENATFKKVMLRHFPSLKKSLSKMDNAFFSWRMAVKNL